MELPPALRQAVDQALHGVALADLKRAADVLSRRYRGEVRDGRLHLSDRLAAQAYLATRLPATYAAIRASLAAISEVRPDFAPKTLLDVGAGPGSVLWAARDCWESLDEATLVETSDAIRKVGADVSANAAPTRISWVSGDVETGLPALPPADIVTLAYVLDELPPPLIGRCHGPAVGAHLRYSRHRRTGHTGRLATHPSGARAPSRCRRISRRAVPASGGLPYRRARLVSFLAPRRPLSPASPRKERRSALGRREIHFHRRLANPW